MYKFKRKNASNRITNNLYTTMCPRRSDPFLIVFLLYKIGHYCSDYTHCTAWQRKDFLHIHIALQYMERDKTFWTNSTQIFT